MTGQFPTAVTWKEAEAVTGKHRTTLCRLIKLGEFPGYVTSMGYIIPRLWFEAWQRGEWISQPNPEPEPQEQIQLLHSRRVS